MSGKEIGGVFKTCWRKYRYVGLVVLVGAALLLWPGGGAAAQPAAAAQETADLQEVREEMETILSRIDGVGELSLMLTVESDGERQLAQDTELSYRGQTEAPEDYSRRAETVVVSGSGGSEAVVTRRLAPVYRGALVVCQGGGKAEVRLAVTEAVAALTGLSSDRIQVAVWQ